MHKRTHIHHPWSAEFASFLKMSNLTIENLFQKTLADVKAALETVSEQCFIESLVEAPVRARVARGVTLCWPPKAFLDIRQHQFVGTFPKKRALDKQRKELCVVSS